MATKIVQVNQIKSGSFILIDGIACKTVNTESSKSGKHGHAKVRITAVGLMDNKKREIVMPAGNTVEVPIIEKKTAQVLSINGNMANVMDNDTYETFDLEIPEDLKEQIVEGAQILYWIILETKVMKQIKGAN